jgi:hypothetical protein
MSYLYHGNYEEMMEAFDAEIGAHIRTKMQLEQTKQELAKGRDDLRTQLATTQAQLAEAVEILKEYLIADEEKNITDIINTNAKALVAKYDQTK